MNYKPTLLILSRKIVEIGRFLQSKDEDPKKPTVIILRPSLVATFGKVSFHIHLSEIHEAMFYSERHEKLASEDGIGKKIVASAPESLQSHGSMLCALIHGRLQPLNQKYVCS